MKAPYCRALAQDILNACVEGQAWPADAVQRLLGCASHQDTEAAQEGSTALFQVLAEGIADRFDPGLSEAYAEIFSRAIAVANPAFEPEELVSRYRRIRRPKPFLQDPGRIRKVVVLSRVTLGADIAISSVILDAVKRRFPTAEIFLAGGEKSRQLFSADARIRWLPVSYGRASTLRERLSVGEELTASLSSADSIVIDPDSRLTQLGLLPVCPEENYFFFDSRSAGGEGRESLTALVQRWVGEVFDVPDASPYIAPSEKPEIGADPIIAINLGVGENPAKRVPDPFEAELLGALLKKGTRLMIDLGGGREEEERVRRVIARCGAGEEQARTWRGSFAGFASIISRSRLYVGYDSAGQHAAAVYGTPLVTIFSGFTSDRMFARWHATGPGPKEVIRVDRPDPQVVLDQTLAAIDRLTCTSRR